MLVQRLTEYAERLPEPLPPMYQEQSIRYLIELDSDGTLRGVVPRGESDGGDRGNLVAAPHVKRTVGIRPKLLADNAEYVLGLARSGSKAERVREQHDQFVALVQDCAAVTGDEQVQAVAAFLRKLDLATLKLPEGFEPAANLTFSFDGDLPIDHDAVRRYWARIQGADGTEDITEDGESVERLRCIGCGQERPALRRHPIKIKGIPGGQIGKDLISANNPAFESYGLDNSLIAPTCQTCAEAYGNALNALLSNPATHLRMKASVYAFWAAGATDFDLVGLFDEPEDRDVQQVLKAPWTGEPGALNLDPTAYYAICLGPSGARVVVRDWIDATVSEAKHRVGRYFAAQALVDYDGSPGPWLPIWRLANSTVRDPRKEAPPATVPGALLRFALAGTALPWDLLYQSVRRIRAEGEVRRDRAALIKMVLLSRAERGTMEDDALTRLDLEGKDPAYLYGRLLAILDAIQNRALNNPNATIVDKYYGSASSAPASVFGTLMHGARPHLAKLRKEERTKPAARAFEKQLEAVTTPLTEFKPTLTLQEQGLFALGFYHQRAEDRQVRDRRSAARGNDGEETEHDGS